MLHRIAVLEDLAKLTEKNLFIAIAQTVSMLGGIIFLHVNSFCRAVPPRQDCSFSLDSACFYNHYVKLQFKSAIHLIKFSSVDAY